MGNTHSIPPDSYLDRHACSGRNITWQYIHNAGILPFPYTECNYAGAILRTHCCDKGVCNPAGLLNGEFTRYTYGNWDGLGDPYDGITNTTVRDWKKGGNGRKGLCLGMEGSLFWVKKHWPPKGIDGLPVKNFTVGNF